MPFFSSTFSPASSLRAGIQPEHDSRKLKWLKTTAAIRKLLGTFTWVLTPVCWSFACNSCKPRHSSFSAILIYFVSQLDMLIQFPAVEGFWFQDKSKKNLNRGSNSYRSRNSWLLDSAFSSGTLRAEPASLHLWDRQAVQGTLPAHGFAVQSNASRTSRTIPACSTRVLFPG